MKTDVLAFVEDPGAANFVLPVLAELETRGLTVALRTAGAAAAYANRPSIEGNESAEALMARLKPRGILVGTSENARTLGLALIDAAKQAGVPVAAAVDALGNAAARFRGLSENPLRHAPDLILVADEATARAFASLGHPQDRIRICGHPQHDAVRERARALDAEGRANVRRRVFERPDQGRRPIIVFASEVSTGIGTEIFRRDASYTLTGSGRFDLRTEVVIEEFLAGLHASASAPYLVLRMHPKNTRDELAPFLDAFDEVSAGGPGLDVVYAADAVVGMTSILLVEAMLLGRPVLSILPREEERNLLSELQSGLIPMATTSAGIRGGLLRLVNSPQAAARSVPGTVSASAYAADAVIELLT